jgi:GDP/UDP-N,N'-diacetylbacillosamine 2-epimerase (hydrolysing)
MIKRKIVVTTGSRSDYGLLRPILHNISINKNLELYLIVTGTHLSKQHGLTINEIRKDGFKIYTTFKMLPKNDIDYSVSEMIGCGIIYFSKIFQKIKPDINLVLGDRDEMLSSTIAAYHMNIPNAHIHGGDVSGGIDEYTRHAITKMSNIHFASTEKSMNRILKMGENPKYVFNTGSPAIDEILDQKITTKKQLNLKYNLDLNGNEIILIYHPVTTQSYLSELQIKNILNVLNKLNKVIIVIGPNSDLGNTSILKQIKFFAKNNSLIKLYPNLPRSDYLGLLKYVKILVGNSSSALIEASYFNVKVVNIGIRQKGREKGPNVIDATNDVNSIKNSIKYALNLKPKKSKIYGTGKASYKIVRTLEKIKLDKTLIEKYLSY